MIINMYNISKTRTIAILLTFLLIACNSTTTKNSSESSTNVTQIQENQVSKPEIENAKRVVA
ncbi:MAG: hypothetical protein HC836_50450 [Richelia sp. RM2_1_2]|nr:hypothetical protein [Richelia sp. RM2_1_2]